MGTFKFEDLHCTGVQKVREFSEVEFRVHSKKNGPDYAYEITRPGGHLMTFETHEVGQKRRKLGSRYSPGDILANIDTSKRRYKGLVLHYDVNKLSGTIFCHDHPTRVCFFHLDDCHIAGPHFMRFQQEVEFSLLEGTNEITLRCADV